MDWLETVEGEVRPGSFIIVESGALVAPLGRDLDLTSYYGLCIDT